MAEETNSSLGAAAAGDVELLALVKDVAELEGREGLEPSDEGHAVGVVLLQQEVRDRQVHSQQLRVGLLQVRLSKERERERERERGRESNQGRVYW